jgi:hypothetical protein
LLLGGYPWLLAAATDRSGAPLARALATQPAVSIGYEDCYSPGTDYLLGRSHPVRSALGHPVTSNYVIRYRDTLRVRGLWRLRDAWPDGAEPEVRVAESRRQPVPPEGYEEFHRDARFVAFRRRTR